MKQTVLTFGASGAQGAPVAEQLLREGYAVRSLLRHPERAGTLAAAGAQVIQGDLDVASDIERAMHGVQAVYLMLPFGSGGNPIARAANVFSAARAAGVQLLVLNTSGQTPRQPTGDPMLDYRIALEAMLRDSGVPGIVLRPWVYLENLLGPWTAPGLRERGELAYPIPAGHAVSWVTSSDLGTLVAAALARPDLAGQAFDVGGPEPLTGEALAAQIGRGLGRPVRYHALSPEAFADIMAGVMGPQARDAVLKAYQATAAAPADAMSIDMASALKQLPVQLTSAETWARTVGRVALGLNT
jgi:uncharacterized protein YbjT (DUF2867 family)